MRARRGRGVVGHGEPESGEATTSTSRSPTRPRRAACRSTAATASGEPESGEAMASGVPESGEATTMKELMRRVRRVH
jgi:hypothetical protein